MNFGVCVLILNDEGKVLSVSRKDDKNDIGLPAGKIEAGETPIDAALRELFEETGYKITDPRYIQLIYHAETDGKLTVTYQIPHNVIKHVSTTTENGVVAWVNPSVLAVGKTFGDYNRGLFKAIGIRDNVTQDEREYRFGMATEKKIASNKNKKIVDNG